jgi:hypothetical protein
MIGEVAQDAPAKKRSKQKDWSASGTLNGEVVGWLAQFFARVRSSRAMLRSEPPGHNRGESLRHRMNRLISNVRSELGEGIRRAADQAIQALHGQRRGQTLGQKPMQYPERLLRQPDSRRRDSCTGCDTADHFLHAAVVRNIVDLVFHAIVENSLLEDLGYITDVNVVRDRFGAADVKKRDPGARLWPNCAAMGWACLLRRRWSAEQSLG